MAPVISRTSDRDEDREGSGWQGRVDRRERVPVVEEGLAVGKRAVATGGVRVTSRVVEAPVEETVRLREERVEAARRPADRKLSPAEADAVFADRTVEMTGTGEEAEVGKTARVVEEVTLGKRAGEREATVRDTVRRTEVEVEELEAKPRDER